MRTYTVLFLFLISNLCLSQASIQSETDTYFKKVNFDWEKVHGHFLDQLKEWDFAFEKGELSAHLFKFYNEFDRFILSL